MKSRPLTLSCAKPRSISRILGRPNTIVHLLALSCATFALLPLASEGQGAQSKASSQSTPIAPVGPTTPAPDPTLGTYLKVLETRMLADPGGSVVPVEFALLPSSATPISAFAVRLTGHYADGSTVATPLWEDDLEGANARTVPGSWTVRQVPWAGPLVAGEVRPGRSQVRGSSAGHLLSYVDGQVTAIVFLDRTARGDKEVIEQIAAGRKAQSDEQAAFIANLQAAINDPGVRDALAGRPAVAGERFLAAFRAQPQPADDPGKSAFRASRIRRFVNALSAGKSTFDAVLARQQELQALYAAHSVLQEAK